VDSERGRRVKWLPMATPGVVSTFASVGDAFIECDTSSSVQIPVAMPKDRY
jgi:hypothetical protein